MKSKRDQARPSRRLRASAVALTLLAGCMGAPLEGAWADDEVEVRYGVVKGQRPTVISKGLFGTDKKPGMTYTIVTTGSDNDQVEVSSENTSFLVGDCVAIEGQGKKSELVRAQPHLCGAQADESAKAFVAAPHTGLFGAAGAGDDESCKQARKEVDGWPPGPGRRRALLRELLACNEGGGRVGQSQEDRECSAAWTEVERLPFGPARATAREHAREVCEDD